MACVPAAKDEIRIGAMLPSNRWVAFAQRGTPIRRCDPPVGADALIGWQIWPNLAEAPFPF
jgi:hypothetical protein